MENLEKLMLKKEELKKEALNLTENGELEKAENLTKKIEELNFDLQRLEAEEQKKLNMANQKAFEENQKLFDFEEKTIKTENLKTIEEENKMPEIKNYEEIFSKKCLGISLNEGEIEQYNFYNPENLYTHTTVNTPVAIPQTVIAGIIAKAEEAHPFFADCRKLNIKGEVKFVKHTAIAAGDAAWYDEATATADEQNTFGSLILKGNDLSKAVSVTWKLQAMAVSDFTTFLQEELGSRIGAALGKAVISGTGVNQPTGVKTALAAYNSKSQIIENKAISYDLLCDLLSKVSSDAAITIYASNLTIWNSLAKIKDTNGRPIFISDSANGGVGKLFGYTLKAEDALDQYEVLVGDAYKGYVVNTSQPLTLVTENHAKARTTDFVGYEVVDGGVLREDLFALLDGIAPV